jgi:5,5'-dehydrodivanillate O-demethylase
MTIFDRYSVLTHVGPGTPMGRYMRFFWHPIAAAEELKDHPKPVRILGEDLVLFRTTNGKLGLLAQRCAHRSASLGCGMIEDDGIRCAYHAWKYDLTGQCVDIPSERGDRKVSSRIKIPGYQVHEAGGLIWAYLGAQPAPLFPRYEFIVGEQYDHDVGLSELPCNWLQIAENNMDPYHVEYLHFMYTNYVHERIGKPKIPVRRHAKIDFEVFEYGIIKRRLWEGDSEDSEEWTIGHPQIWPGTAIVTYPNGGVQAQIRTPIDDTNTRIYWYNAKLRPAGQPADPICPTFDNPFRKADGGYHVETLNGQDMVVMVTQGEITDRTLENLVNSDRGVVLYRRVLLEQLDRIARGEDPLGVVRDPAKNTPFIELPMEKRVDYTLAGVSATPDRSWDNPVPKEAAE